MDFQPTYPQKLKTEFRFFKTFFHAVIILGQEYTAFISSMKLFLRAFQLFVLDDILKYLHLHLFKNGFS